MTIPHFAFPFTIGQHGSAVVLEQDDPAEIEQNVKVLVQTEIGERLEVPEFGIPDPTFRVGIDLDALVGAAAEWDSRALVFAEADLLEMVQNVRIHVEER